MAALKRNYEREYNEMATSFANEHEEMQTFLTGAVTECNELKDKYVQLDIKFKQYYMKSDHHIKEQASELNAVRKELETMQYRHKNHETLLKKAEANADKFEGWYKELEEPFLKQKEELHKMKIEVIKYEQKYGFIDLDKLVEDIAVQKTLADESRERAEVLQIDLFTLREKIIDITQDIDKVNPSKVKKAPKHQGKWKAGEDVENLGLMLSKYLTNAS